ncbi:MAG: histidine phosphotransferase family protein [Rickettsiales bacterium]
MTSDTRLAEMLATRLCHDLTGPIGAVNNGAEFLDEEGFDMQNEAIQLILSSAHEAVNRLQFYRQAYGRVGDAGEACLADKKKIASDFFSGTKVKLDWPDSHTDAAGVPLSQKMSRLLLNLMIIAGSSLIRGGTLSVRLQLTDTGDKQLQFVATGETVKFDGETAAILGGRDDVPLSPKSAQPYLTMMLAEELGATLQCEVSGDALNIVATQRQLAMASAS